MSCPKDERTSEQGGSWNAGTEKKNLYRPPGC